MTLSPCRIPMSSPLAARFRSEERLTRACVGESVVMRRYYVDIASNSSHESDVSAAAIVHHKPLTMHAYKRASGLKMAVFNPIPSVCPSLRSDLPPGRRPLWAG